MKVYNKNDGFSLGISNKKERDKTWELLGKDLKTGQTFYTPNDNLPYEILSEEEKGGNRVQYVIRANGETGSVTCSFLNKDKSIFNKVRKMHE